MATINAIKQKSKAEIKSRNQKQIYLLEFDGLCNLAYIVALNRILSSHNLHVTEVLDCRSTSKTKMLEVSIARTRLEKFDVTSLARQYLEMVR